MPLLHGQSRNCTMPKKKKVEPEIIAVIKPKDGEGFNASDAVAAALKQGWEIKLQMDQLQEQLDAANEIIRDAVETGSSISIPGVCKSSVYEQARMAVSDPDSLRGLLGGRFGDLVKEEAVYKLRDALKDIVKDSKNPLSEPVRECLKISSSVIVKYSASA